MPGRFLGGWGGDTGLDSTARSGATRTRVDAGERIVISRVGNGTPHLHFGHLLDHQVEQESWTYILREHEVRKVLGNYKNGVRLP